MAELGELIFALDPASLRNINETCCLHDVPNVCEFARTTKVFECRRAEAVVAPRDGVPDLAGDIKLFSGQWQSVEVPLGHFWLVERLKLEPIAEFLEAPISITLSLKEVVQLLRVWRVSDRT